MTGNVEQDCDVMVAIFDPVREKMTKYRGYDVTKLPRIIRGIVLLKNRYGDGDIGIGAAFYGACGIWVELPKADKITDYEQFTTLDKLKRTEIEDKPRSKKTL